MSAGPSKSPTADVADEEKCVVGWIEGPVDDLEDPDRPSPTEYQLVALTYTGGWYRLSVPNHAGPNTSSIPSSPVISPTSISPPSVRALAQHRPRSSSGSSVYGRSEKGKGRERDRDRDREKEGKESRDCVLREYRRYGRWDGWG